MLHPDGRAVNPLMTHRVPSEVSEVSGALFEARRIQPITLCVVIPMFNEAKRLAATFATLAASPLNRPDVQFLFVDDGSSDGSSDVALAVSQSMPFARRVDVSTDRQNRGKGSAVRRGMLVALEQKPDYLAFLDADLSLDPAVLDQALELLQTEQVSVVVGNRVVNRAQQPPLRRAVSLAFKGLAARLAPTGVADTQCACKLFTREAAERIFESMQTDGFAFDVEILLRARREGLLVKEMDVKWRHTHGSRVNPALEAFRMTRDVLQIRGKVGPPHS